MTGIDETVLVGYASIIPARTLKPGTSFKSVGCRCDRASQRLAGLQDLKQAGKVIRPERQVRPGPYWSSRFTNRRGVNERIVVRQQNPS